MAIRLSGDPDHKVIGLVVFVKSINDYSLFSKFFIEERGERGVAICNVTRHNIPPVEIQKKTEITLEADISTYKIHFQVESTYFSVISNHPKG